jgi:23S rRNA pseudouridine1911/1915/1917 synthase
VQLSIEPNPRLRFNILHEDEHLLVVNKPPGLVTQPGKGHERDTLLNGLFARFGHQLQNLGKARDFGLLHRLDRSTSGLVLVALRASAYDALRAQFETRRIVKVYLAISREAPSTPTGVINRPIDEYQTTRQRERKKLARISSAGLPAATAYRVLDANREGCLMECRPITGRLHQVRVHLASIHCPLLGDPEYAPEALVRLAPRLALHAQRVILDHPGTGARLQIDSPLPGDLKSLLKKLKLDPARELWRTSATADSGLARGKTSAL